ncbi:hypothetical protein [Adhaeribacter soli]|uniref:Uncharacterized protein n=1 Tax=Adhaeribacter soli TaxID=2607655 RepID=A0A5N1J172_9BACT|nr:hypothetical protein [Adhaeribacter soli]KAA9340533.1 hypothetical protein F0P94_03650 [Adhaeribacter soli]
MKPKIRFTSLETQADQSAYWKTKSYAERLAEGFRLTQKAYWEYYSQPEPKMERRSRLFVKQPDETLEEFFARKNRSK